MGLVDHFFRLHRGHARLQSRREHDPEGVHPLAAQEGRQDGQEAGLLVQVVLLDDLVQGELGKAFDELFVVCPQLLRLRGEMGVKIGAGLFGHCHDTPLLTPGACR